MKHLISIWSILTISLFVPLSTSATDKAASENYNSCFDYAMVCPECGSGRISRVVNESEGKIYYFCQMCDWKGEDKLPTN